MTLIEFLPKPREPCRNMIGYFYLVSHFLNISFLTRTLVQASSLSGTTIVMVRQVWSAGILAIHSASVRELDHILSLDPALCRTRVEDIHFIKYFL